MPFPTVVVGGVHKGAGKTTLACFLLRGLRGWGALKVTTTHEGIVCPVEASCTACGELQGPYLAVREAAILDQEGTDTWKMGRAGAARVVWLRATPERLADGLRAVLPDFEGLPGVVVEGTNVARHLGELYLLAARPPVRKIKPSARATAARADLAVWNLPPRSGSVNAALADELPVFARAWPFRGMQPEAAENDLLLREVLGRLAPLAQRIH
jgi:molybdopterin-guanine dinucleotide biosynthesis protein